MKDYCIITDATSDMPVALIEQMNITVIPMSFEIAGMNYLHYPDGRELSPASFYQMLRSGETATTAQINFTEYFDCFERIFKQKKDILYICFSSALSSTYQSSLMAAKELMEKYPDRRIFCIDSLCASAGEGMLAYYAVLKKNEGYDIDRLREWVLDQRHQLCHWFTVADLGHLKRGGRISQVAATLGTALSIKPILHVDKKGQLTCIGKVRGRQKSIEALITQMENTCISPQEQVVFIAHGDCIDDATHLAATIKSRLQVKDVVITHIGPIIGSHTGADALTLFFFGTER